MWILNVLENWIEGCWGENQSRWTTASLFTDSGEEIKKIKEIVEIREMGHRLR